MNTEMSRLRYASLDMTENPIIRVGKSPAALPPDFSPVIKNERAVMSTKGAEGDCVETTQKNMSNFIYHYERPI